MIWGAGFRAQNQELGFRGWGLGLRMHGLQGYLYYKKPEISKRSVSVSYLGGHIKKLSENARCPFLNYARKPLNFARK